MITFSIFALVCFKKNNPAFDPAYSILTGKGCYAMPRRMKKMIFLSITVTTLKR